MHLAFKTIFILQGIPSSLSYTVPLIWNFSKEIIEKKTIFHLLYKNIQIFRSFQDAGYVYPTLKISYP